MVAKILPWVVTVLLSIVAPIIVYQVATANGVGEVNALILSALPPLLEMAITALVRHRLDEISTIVLIAIVVGIITSLFFDDPRLLLLKESVLTGLLGLGYLVTVFTSRPAVFLLGRRFATNGDPERITWWNGLWQYQGFRRTMRGMTAMWGLGLAIEAAVRAWLTFVLSVGTMVVVNNVVPPVVIGVLMLANGIWGKRAQAAGARRAAELEKAEADKAEAEKQAASGVPGDPQPA